MRAEESAISVKLDCETNKDVGDAIHQRYAAVLKLDESFVKQAIENFVINHTWIHHMVRHTNTKERATDALEAMGLLISDAIRLLILRVANERRLPFAGKVPNSTTRKAVAELESGKGKRFCILYLF